MHRHGKYLWSLCKTVQIFEPQNINLFRLHMWEGFQQIILLKSEADAGLKQINVIDETFRIYFHLICLFSSLFFNLWQTGWGNDLLERCKTDSKSELSPFNQLSTHVTTLTLRPIAVKLWKVTSALDKNINKKKLSIQQIRTLS